MIMSIVESNGLEDEQSRDAVPSWWKMARLNMTMSPKQCQNN